ncbi:hypothetical protein [Belnapia rosea]|uniref:hypothetical protein n=1 Tax=Belnapia rosea TaxID=938405 RepID=UPI0008868D6D|nr:hypothetical protein [Belnapia rosea]SDB43843.1 hypothetical protein SAMN02927895_01564 [Belnapia rosea]
MNTKQFARALDRHGPVMAGWPETERAAAATLLAGSAEARGLLQAALALDARLRRDLPQPDAAAVARLQAGIARRIARAPLPSPPGPLPRLLALLRPAAPAGWGALATMATCALWLSLSPPRAAPEDPFGPLQTLPLAGDLF